MQVKHQLLAHCQQYVNQRLETITQAQAAIRQALDEETKSTAGDKHETGRAMMQLEQEKLSAQLAEVQQLQQVLGRIQLENLPSRIGEGNLVLTGQGNYFIAISAGKLELDGKLYYLVSLASPIGLALAHRKAGEQFVFRGESISILAVF
ncbi:MAG: 3-oxoacyl-ACP synthase [Bacteroidetes bacterium]|nr:3-oxoacyl-ACP synthase [Bacteroidota bacterium]